MQRSTRITQRETGHGHASTVEWVRRGSRGGPQVLLLPVAPADRRAAPRHDASRRDVVPDGEERAAVETRAARTRIGRPGSECRTRRRRRRDLARRREKGRIREDRITSMIEGARRCRLEGRGDARVGEPDAEGQQAAEQRARRRLRQHISSASPRPRSPRPRPRRRHGIVLAARARRGSRRTVLRDFVTRLSHSRDSLAAPVMSHSRARTRSTLRFLKEHRRLTARDGLCVARALARSLAPATAHRTHNRGVNI